MKPKHLKALEHLPAVIEALEALDKQQSRLRALMMRTGVAHTTKGGEVLAPVHLSAPVQLAVHGNGGINVETAQPYTPNPVSPLDAKLKAEQDARKAERLAFLKSRQGEREEKLRQFSPAAPGEQVVEIVHESELTTISGDA